MLAGLNHLQLLTINYFHKKVPSKMFDWVLNTSRIYHHSGLTLNSIAFLHIAIFRFFAQTNPQLTMLLKQYNAKRKMISENIIIDTVKRTCRNFNSFNFHQFLIFINDTTEYRHVFVVQRTFCQLQINSQ